MEHATGAIRIPPSRIVRHSLVPIVLRALVFLGIGTLGLLLFVMYVGAVQGKVFDYSGDVGTAGRIFVVVLLAASELAAITAAVAATNFMDGKKGFGLLRGRGCATAAGQKLLLVCLVVQLLMLPAWHSAYFKSFAAIAFAIYVVTLGFGFSARRQVLWICLGILPTFSMGLFAVVDLRGPNSSLLLTWLLPVGLVVFQLIVILMLSRRATRALRAEGVTVKFFGVPFPAIPPLFESSGPSMPEGQPEAPHREGTANEDTPTPESSTAFHYLGLDNEPIGPISPDVLLQLRESGLVTDETLVAPEGASRWKPLHAYLEVTEEAPT